MKNVTTASSLRNPIDGNNLLRLSNHDSPVLEVKRLSGTHINTTEEQEEAV